MRYEILWPDGSQTSGPSASSVLDQVAAVQFSDEACENIRASLAWRCYVLTGEAPDITVDDDQFLQQCASLDLFDLTVTA